MDIITDAVVAETYNIPKLSPTKYKRGSNSDRRNIFKKSPFRIFSSFLKSKATVNINNDEITSLRNTVVKGVKYL
jgi:hypothetical protein